MENSIKLTCLVLEPVGLVADDLITMIEDALPGTRVLVAWSTDVAMEVLRAGRVDIAFLNLSPVMLARSGLVERLEQQGTTVVILGHEAATPDARHRFLERPFVSSAIAAELRAAMRRLLGFPAPPDGTNTA